MVLVTAAKGGPVRNTCAGCTGTLVQHKVHVPLSQDERTTRQHNTRCNRSTFILLDTHGGMHAAATTGPLCSYIVQLEAVEETMLRRPLNCLPICRCWCHAEMTPRMVPSTAPAQQGSPVTPAPANDASALPPTCSICSCCLRLYCV
jgi:hypothetical protein